MRYSTQHKEALRQRLIEHGRALCKAGGFKATSVDCLMESVGLSGAAFYRHFRSKEEFFSILLQEEMTQSLRMLAGRVSCTDEEFARSLRGYLSLQHATHPEQGCALPALGAEIARGQSHDRGLVEQSLAEVKKRWQARLQDDSDAAWSALAQCVGALLLSRVVETDDTRREILSAVRRATGKLFGVSLTRAPSQASQSHQAQSKK